MTGIICINKHKDISSFGVVNKVRGITGEKKAGHTGTLDPMATGVLPVMLGGATKFLNYLPESDKGYKATFILGVTTDTLDVTGNVIEKKEVNSKVSDVKKSLEKFKGVISQVPPMYSAKSVDGKRLYELARQGKTVERKPCKVRIKSLELVDFDEENNSYTIEVLCSKGTYIRSLIDDIGKDLGCGATMSELNRTLAMGFSLDSCVTIDQLQKIKDDINDFSSVLVNVETMFSCYKKIFVTDRQSTRFFNGGSLDINRINAKIEPNEICCVYGSNKEFLGLGQRKDDELCVLRVLSKKTNYYGK